MVRRRTAVTLSVRNLAAIAQKVEKSYLYQERSDHETDMIRRMKRRVTPKVKRIVLYGNIKNQVSCPTD